MWKIRSFWRNNKAATAIEYGMIAAFIAIAVIGAVRSIGTGTEQSIADIATGIQNDSGSGS